MSELKNNRCTFAIISHPDAGKTTMTEKNNLSRKCHPRNRYGEKQKGTIRKK